MDLNSPMATVVYGATTATLAGLVQWFLMPEVGLPDMSDPTTAMNFERFCHYCSAFCFGNAALHYYLRKPKVFWDGHYGIFLIACMLQHVIEQGLHEIGTGTMEDIQWQNKLMTTYGVVVPTLYMLTHGGPIPLFKKLANQPFLVFFPMVVAMVETQGKCRRNNGKNRVFAAAMYRWNDGKHVPLWSSLRFG